MKLHLDEQQLGIDITASEKEAIVTVTGYPKYMRKLSQLAEKYPQAYKLTGTEKDENGEIYCLHLRIDKRYIRFGKPASEARCEAARERLQKVRAENAEQEAEDGKADLLKG
jgi:hypothetical protein